MSMWCILLVTNLLGPNVCMLLQLIKHRSCFPGKNSQGMTVLSWVWQNAHNFRVYPLQEGSVNACSIISLCFTRQHWPWLCWACRWNSGAQIKCFGGGVTFQRLWKWSDGFTDIWVNYINKLTVGLTGLHTAFIASSGRRSSWQRRIIAR